MLSEQEHGVKAMTTAENIDTREYIEKALFFFPSLLLAIVALRWSLLATIS